MTAIGQKLRPEVPQLAPGLVERCHRQRGASIGRYAEKRPLEAPEKDYAVAIPRPSNATWGVGQGLDRATGDSDF